MSFKRRKVYGTSEIAEIIKIRRETLSAWNARGKLPPPDERLSSGPVWFPETIEPWIEGFLDGTTIADRRRKDANIEKIIS